MVTRWRSCGDFGDFNYVIGVVWVIGDTHVVEAVGVFNVFVVEPGAVASFPTGGAEHAELSCTAASHMITSLFQLNHGLTIITPLPPFLLRHMHQPLRLLILRTLPPRMKLAITKHTHLRPTPSTLRIFPPNCQIHADLTRFNPLPTLLRRAINPILRVILLILFVPQLLELIVEEPFHVFERDVLVGAAAGGHVLGVVDGEGELTFDAGVTHAVAAGKPGSLVGREVVSHADDAFNL